MFLHPVCQAFCSQGGGVHPPRQISPWADTPGQTPLPPLAYTPRQTPHSRDGYCSRWYASYWNAFSLWFVFTLVWHIYMSHFSYSCKMRYPLNLVLENWEYLWFYLTFCIVILDCGLKLHKPSIHTLVMLQK